MSKKAKLILSAIALFAAVAMSVLAWRSCTHKQVEQDQSDSLQVLRDQAKARANDNQNKGDSANQLYVQDLKKYNSPADSAERANVWAEYWNSVTADTNGKGAIR